MNPEICFNGETTLESGLTIGIQVELEGQLPTADFIDEQFLYITSEQFGKLMLGSADNAAYQLHVGSPDGGISVDSGDVLNNSFYVSTAIIDLFNTPAGTTFLLNNDNDSQKITYFTPRVYGFQAGVSYIPKFQPGGGKGNDPNFVAGTNNGQHNGWAGALNFTEEFGDWAVSAYGGYLWAMQPEVFDADGSPDDLSAYGLGAQVGYSGISVGGAYHRVTSGRVSAGGPGTVDLGTGTLTQVPANGLAPPTSTSTVAGSGASMKGWSYTAGASYEIGPYVIGASWLQSETEGSIGDPTNQELRLLAVSGTYRLGPGVRLVGGIFWFEETAEASRFSGGLGTNPADFVEAGQSDTDGWGGAVGLKISF
jgi:hypothetical protein